MSAPIQSQMSTGKAVGIAVAIIAGGLLFLMLVGGCMAATNHSGSAPANSAPARSSAATPAASPSSAAYQQGQSVAEALAKNPSAFMPSEVLDWVTPDQSGAANVACQWAWTARAKTSRPVADNAIAYIHGCEAVMVKHGWSA